MFISVSENITDVCETKSPDVLPAITSTDILCMQKRLVMGDLALKNLKVGTQIKGASYQ
jgi:hypothetical protein